MMWLLENLETLFALWGLIVALCTVIVKITPTDKDNKILEKITKYADMFSVAFTKEDAETLAKALKKSKK